MRACLVYVADVECNAEAMPSSGADEGTRVDAAAHMHALTPAKRAAS